jgi:hypothetical protein
MADQLQLRGGTTAQHATFTGALREVTVDTDKKTVVVHDGSTAGGNPLLRQDLSNLPAGTIDNADINASAGIVDTKLATISTAGKVSNSATTATNANTASAIVARDGSGNFTAGTITAALTGAASSNVLKAGDTMTGNLTVPSLNGGPMAGTRNRIINGDMRIDQRNAGASAANINGYGLDRWTSFNVANSFSMQRSTVAPAGFTNSLLLTTTTSATPAAADYRYLSQLIEGFNVADLAYGTASAVTIALSFWVRSSLTGTFSGALKNSAENRSYPFTFSVSSANTFEYKTITIPGDTSGTWLADSGIGLRVVFDLGSGSNRKGTAGAWAGVNADGATGAVNLVATNGATFYITGVQLEPGTVATPFERRSYGQELALCQRYYYKINSANNTGAFQRYAFVSCKTTVDAEALFTHPVVMRASPTLGSSVASSFHTFSANATTTISSLVIDQSSPANTDVALAVASGLTAGRTGLLNSNNNNTSFIEFSAEL